MVLAVGMQFTLAFLPVGLVVALVVLSDRETSASRTELIAVLATGVGFLGLTLVFWAVTRANPFVIWWWNQRNHARFYAEFPRSYRAWVVANPVELAVALGSAGLGLGVPGRVVRRARRRGSVVATAAVLAFLTLGGRNLSEVARLWLPFMPASARRRGRRSMRTAGGGTEIAGGDGRAGRVQTLVLEATIQVVYPI